MSEQFWKLSLMYTAFLVFLVQTILVRKRINWLAVTPAFVLSENGRPVVAEGFVYVFAAKTMLKVGMTRFSPYRRWHSIQTGNPWLEAPLYISPPLMKRVAAMEKACHAALAQYRRSGEWFECDRQLAIDTVRTICND